MKTVHWFRCVAIICCGFFVVTHPFPVRGAAKRDPSAKDPASSGSQQGAGAQGAWQAWPPWQGYFKKKNIEEKPKATCSSDVQWKASGGKSFPNTYIQDGDSKVACPLSGGATFCVDSISSKGKLSSAKCLAVNMSEVQCGDAYHLSIPVLDVAGAPMEFFVACSIGTTASKYCAGGGLCVTDPPSCIDSDNSKLADPTVAAVGLALADKSWSTFGKTDDGYVFFGGGSLGTDSCKNPQWLIEKVCEQKWDAAKKAVTYTAADVLVDCHSKKMGCEKSKGICVADLCPTVPGNQIDYPYYFTQVIPGGAATVGSCEPPAADKCPTVVGDQAEFIYDADGDGIKDSCYLLDEKVCSDPDPAKTYPDATIYAYGKELHLGLCADSLQDGTAQILHVICDEAGKITQDITSCQEKMPCAQGKCGTCLDDDGGVNWEIDGVVWYVDEITGGNKAFYDQCQSVVSTSIKEGYCYAGKLEILTQNCPKGTHCKDEPFFDKLLSAWVGGAKCVSDTGKPTCVDHDGGFNLEVTSYADGTDGDGKPVKEDDLCAGCYITEAICVDGANGGKVIILSDVPCPANTACKMLENGSLSCEPFTITTSCTDHDGGLDFSTLSYAESVDPFGNTSSALDGCGKTPTYMIEAVCKKGMCGGTVTSEVDTVGSDCPSDTHCEKVQEGLGCVLNCSDTDPLNESHVPGLVTDAGKIAYPDFCENNVLKQYACDPATFKMVPVPPFTCAKGCVNGMCVP